MALASTTKLTRGQKRVLAALVDSIKTHGYPPSTRELAEALGIKAPSVHEQLRKLEAKGFIRREKNRARSIEILRSHPQELSPSQESAPSLRVPVVGTIAAGVPILANENRLGEVEVRGVRAGRGSLFALRVQGDSMIECGIEPDDFVIVRQQPVAERGDIVAALLGDEATVKRLKIDADSVQLLPENRSYRPIDVTAREDFRILGKVLTWVKSDQ